ncbi:MAG: baseplate J/gp47 family protein [Chloroflexota bacterium]
MKTTLITLESHDDLISIRDRMSWAKTPRILLILPKFEKVTLRQVDLKVLQRHAAALGAQLGLVTRWRRVRAEAEALGIPVFKSTKEAQRGQWSQPARREWQRRAPDKTLREKREQVQIREEAWRAHPVTRIVSFSIGVLAVLALVALFLPRAQIQLKPVVQTQSVEIPVSADPAAAKVFITGVIPAREKRIVVEGTQQVTVTGEGAVPQSKAKGAVVFRNLTQNALTIPIGTVVTAGDVRFVTTELGVLNAGVGETVTLRIEAVQGGAAGNVEAGVINAVEGRLGLLASVTNPEPTSGGRERASTLATDADRERARQLLLKTLEADALARLRDELAPGDVPFEQTFALVGILSEASDPPPGTAASQLTLTLQAEYSMRYASASDLTELGLLALNASLPSGFFPATETVTVDSVSVPRLQEDGSVRWKVRAKRNIVQQVDAAQVTRLVMGLSVSEAQSLLSRTLPVQSEPKLTLTPSWWRWVPIVPFRIEVREDER